MAHETLSLFPLTNPVLKFSLLLFIILITPYIFKKIKIPPIIGLILSGTIIGPHGISFMQRDSSIILYGTVGLLYIMFIAGLEIDIADFKRNKHKSIIFGLYTFLIPMFIGFSAMYHLLKLPILSSVLISSFFASHTLVTYPIITRYGITKNRAVNITIGGTMITDVLALLVLAVIVGLTKSTISFSFWTDLLMKFSFFVILVAIAFPIVTREFLKRENDSVGQYIFILGMVFLSAFFAELAGVEAIIGAFLAGLALNPLIPRNSGLKNRIEFIGNALFIPIFLIGVGMLINFKSVFTNLTTLWIGLVMVFTATLSKFLAAYLTQKTFRLNNDERSIIFGLSNSQAATTLAAVLVGYNIILGYDNMGEPIRLISEQIMDGTILMILFTCTIASFATQKGAHNLSLKMDLAKQEKPFIETERILIPISYPENMPELIQLGLSVKAKHREGQIFALSILSSESVNEAEERKANELLDKAISLGAATDEKIQTILRYDLNTAETISNVIKELKITDLIIGLHQKKGITDSFLGKITENILKKTPINTFIYHIVQPAHTMKRLVVVFPKNFDKEPGIHSLLQKIWKFCRSNGLYLICFGSESINSLISDYKKKHYIESEMIEFDNWEDFLYISSKIQDNDGLMIIMSRHGMISYNNNMQMIPRYLLRYFNKINYFLVFPIQNDIHSDQKTNKNNLFSLNTFRQNFHRKNVKN